MAPKRKAANSPQKGAKKATASPKKKQKKLTAKQAAEKKAREDAEHWATACNRLMLRKPDPVAYSLLVPPETRDFEDDGSTGLAYGNMLKITKHVCIKGKNYQVCATRFSASLALLTICVATA